MVIHVYSPGFRVCIFTMLNGGEGNFSNKKNFFNEIMIPAGKKLLKCILKNENYIVWTTIVTALTIWNCAVKENYYKQQF